MQSFQSTCLYHQSWFQILWLNLHETIFICWQVQCGQVGPENYRCKHLLNFQEKRFSVIWLSPLWCLLLCGNALKAGLLLINVGRRNLTSTVHAVFSIHLPLSYGFNYLYGSTFMKQYSLTCNVVKFYEIFCYLVIMMFALAIQALILC